MSSNEDVNNENEDNEEGNEVDDEDQEKNNSDKSYKENIGKRELISEYKEKENVYDAITKNNKELKEKIDLTNNKYNEIIKRIEEKQSNDMEYQLKTKINSMEKEIEAYQTENKNYKKKIDHLKNSVYFKNSMTNSSLLKSALMQEKIKNKEYTEELAMLKRIDKYNKNLINKNEEDYKIKKHIKSLSEQIKEVKEYIKQMNERYNILEHYFKLVHEKIVGLDLIKIKKKEIIETKKEEEKKSFTVQEVKDLIQLIITLRTQILEKRIKINNINTNTEDKMHKFFAQNKSIEIDFKDELRIYKDLITRKNELKKLINKLNGKINKQKNINNIKKQDSIKENEININNSTDLNNSNQNNDFNNQILNDKINFETDINNNANQDEIYIIDKNNKEENENVENQEIKDNKEITLNNIVDENKEINQIKEEKIILDNKIEAKEGTENNEIKEFEEQNKENEKVDNINIDDNNNIEENNNIDNIEKNQIEQ